MLLLVISHCFYPYIHHSLLSLPHTRDPVFTYWYAMTEAGSEHWDSMPCCLLTDITHLVGLAFPDRHISFVARKKLLWLFFPSTCLMTGSWPTRPSNFMRSGDLSNQTASYFRLMSYKLTKVPVLQVFETWLLLSLLPPTFSLFLRLWPAHPPGRESLPLRRDWRLARRKNRWSTFYILF